MITDPNGHSFSRSGGQTLGQFSEPERVQSEADGIGVEVRNSEGTCDTTALASHDVIIALKHERQTISKCLCLST
jgi:hypothetical protein